MESASGEDVSILLRALTAGDREALPQLVAVLYQELRRIAYGYMRRERDGHTLQTSALINEAYLRLVGAQTVECEGRIHFLALAAQTMRRILVEHARSRAYLKHGGGMLRTSFEEGTVMAPNRDPELLALDDALTELAKFDNRKAQIVEMRFFAGLSVEETAEALKVSPQTVLRDWKLSKLWLTRQMTPSNP
ncbi:MAG TPA: sigma-70 family RNA polymerase sigma factor [Bryobacteraceae bacterium]